MTRAMYRSQGAAGEYAPLALNLYHGCPHGCTYCYMPRVLADVGRADLAAAFHRTEKAKDGILEQLRKDCVAMTRTPPQGELFAASAPAENETVFLSFSSDPYQPLEAKALLTRKAIDILGSYGFPMRMLTKAALLPRRDFDLMKEHDVEFGVSLAHASTEAARADEPHAGFVEHRFANLRAAHALGIRTWVSLEPVLSGPEALRVIEISHSYVDVYRIGKLNHDPAREDALDWPTILRSTLETLERFGKRYAIKRALWLFADAETRARWPQSNLSGKEAV